MANRMKGFQRYAEAYERRWKAATEQGNTAEMYAATRDYEKNITAQEKELKQMDPSSREYKKAEESIVEQKATCREMERAQRDLSYGESKRNAYEQLEAKNMQLSRDMGRAVERGDVETYESLRSQYEKNLEIQDRLGANMREEGVKYNDTGRQSKQDIYSRDCDMREKLSAKVAERESKGKTVKEEDRAAAEKYREQVKKDEENLVKYNGDRTIQSMRERGASEEQIKAQEEKNQQNQEWVRNINR